MKVRMLTQYAGVHRAVAPGQVADFDDVEAKALIEGGYATDPAKDAPASKPAPKSATPRKNGDKSTAPAGEKTTAPAGEKTTPPAGETATAPAGEKANATATDQATEKKA